uniref:Uncharacterized protein n=1 Tax=Vespula pensylvanica TaxID=30213 RepID=A0A834N107_VESPE|nr:hypothetical protein H0235_017446 [Vespula pensylvanica]
MSRDQSIPLDDSSVSWKCTQQIKVKKAHNLATQVLLEGNLSPRDPLRWNTDLDSYNRLTFRLKDVCSVTDVTHAH